MTLREMLGEERERGESPQADEFEVVVLLGNRINRTIGELITSTGGIPHVSDK